MDQNIPPTPIPPITQPGSSLSTKWKVIIVIISLLGAFASGRYSVPVKIKTTEVSTDNKKVDVDSTKDKHKETTTVTVVKPDGSKETTTKIVEDDKAKTDSTVVDNKTDNKETTVTKGSSRLNISVLGGVGLRGLPTITPVFGAHVSKDLIGPVSIGAFGLSDGTFGASLGLTF